MKLNDAGLKDRQAWEEKGYALAMPSLHMTEKKSEKPRKRILSGSISAAATFSGPSRQM